MNEKSHSPAKRASVALPLLITLVCASISTSQSPAPAEAYQVTVQTGVRVKMRDGAQLVADVYRPKAAGKFPVLLTRTPYNRRDFNTGTYLASRGYVANTRSRTATTPSNGPPRWNTRTETSGCSADHTSERRRCSPAFQNLRI
jgi:hypothetical protein